jgi:hypothetical protein
MDAMEKRVTSMKKVNRHSNIPLTSFSNHLIAKLNLHKLTH